MADSSISPESLQNDIETVTFTDILTVADRFWSANKEASTRVFYTLIDHIREHGPALHDLPVSQVVEEYGGCVSEVLNAARTLSWFGIIEIRDDSEGGKPGCACDACVARRTLISFPFAGDAVRDYIVNGRRLQAEAEANQKLIRSRVSRRMGPEEGSVYLIQAGDRYKIGIARDVVRRMAQLNAGQSPFPILLVHCATGRDYREQESKLHRRFSHFRVHGEWFEFDDEAVLSVIDALNAWAEEQ